MLSCYSSSLLNKSSEPLKGSEHWYYIDLKKGAIL
jgi:hypothetical protein